MVDNATSKVHTLSCYTLNVHDSINIRGMELGKEVLEIKKYLANGTHHTSTTSEQKCEVLSKVKDHETSISELKHINSIYSTKMLSIDAELLELKKKLSEFEKLFDTAKLKEGSVLILRKGKWVHEVFDS